MAALLISLGAFIFFYRWIIDRDPVYETEGLVTKKFYEATEDKFWIMVNIHEGLFIEYDVTKDEYNQIEVGYFYDFLVKEEEGFNVINIIKINV